MSVLLKRGLHVKHEMRLRIVSDNGAYLCIASMPLVTTKLFSVELLLAMSAR